MVLILTMVFKSNSRAYRYCYSIGNRHINYCILTYYSSVVIPDVVHSNSMGTFFHEFGVHHDLLASSGSATVFKLNLA